jgi:erythritol kinase (D-erythritol 1-phosphate-forming)
MKLGIDIGTSVTKATLFGPDGEVRAKRSARTALLRPAPGRYEYEVDEVVDSFLGLLRDLPGDDIDLLALTGQGDGLWLLDEHGSGARPALAWLDARGAPVCEAWAASSVLDQVFARTRNAPFPGAGGALLAALGRTEPDTLARARTATQCQHVVFERLTGVRTATRSCAMLPVFDPVAGDYDDQALRLTGLAPWRGMLPEVAAAPAVVAPLHDRLADRLGLARGTPVATGPYDLPAAALGVGSLGPGDGLLILGTTLACQVLIDHVGAPAEPVGLTLCTGDGARWLRAMPAMVGTACLDWVLGLVRAEHASLGRLLANSPPGANGVSALPYLSPAGERAPFAEPAARAELTGLTLETTAEDVVRAVCEALAYAARHCFEAAGLRGNVVVCGGGSASQELVQLFADVLERPLALASAEEPAARGAVAAAEVAAGDVGRPPTQARGIVHPRPGQRAAEGYADYLYRLGVARRHRWRRATGAPS